MTLETAVEELDLLVRSRYALILLDTMEEPRADAVLRHVASRLSLHHYVWTRAAGLRRGTALEDPLMDDTAEPAKALAFAAREGAALYHFHGLAPHLDDPVVAAHARDAVLRFSTRRGAILLSGHGLRLPDALRAHATSVRIPAPTQDEYRALLERIVRDAAARMPVRVELSPEERARLLANLSGLTLGESARILTRLVIEDGCLRGDDIPRVAAAKRQAVEHEGLLEYCATEERMDDVAGLAGLKAWLAKRRGIVADPERARAFGLPFPKGILLLGVPGCGKSLCAKAVATEWGLPLLRLDPARLYDKYVGASEDNFARALGTAERMAPAILWIDELEKAFAQGRGEDDGGVSTRVFGAFLSWLQERRGDVFVVATSNDVSKLPPELIRKGRFDEVFFVDLPDAAARRQLVEIHLRRRRQAPERFDVGALAAATAGFSGAEIEQAIVAGMYTAFAAGAPLDSAVLLQELALTRPLSATMAEPLQALRHWARTRTAMAA
jgi:hypothetical protein